MRRSSLAFIFITVFVDVLGYSMMIPLLPFFVREFGGGAAIVGTLGSLYAFLQLFSGPALGSLSDRVGRKPVLIACLVGTSASYMIFGFSSALWLLYLAVLLDGLTGNNLTTAYAYVADVTSTEERARGMSLVGAGLGLGLMAGPAIGGLLSAYGLSVPAFAAAGLALLNALYGFLILPESLPLDKRSNHPISFNAFKQLKGLFDLPSIRFLLVSLFFLNLAFAGLQTNFPLFSNLRFHMTPRDNGIFFAYIGVVAVFVQGFLYARIQPKWGEQRLSMVGLALMALGMSGVALAAHAWMLYPIVGLAALGSGISIPSLSGMVSNRMSETQQGLLMGGTQTLLSLTNIIGPTMAGLAFDWIHVSAPYWIASGLALFALWFAARAHEPASP